MYLVKLQALNTDQPQSPTQPPKNCNAQNPAPLFPHVKCFVEMLHTKAKTEANPKAA